MRPSTGGTEQHDRTVSIGLDKISTPETLEVIREEQCTPAFSVILNSASKTGSEIPLPCGECACEDDEIPKITNLNQEQVEQIIKKKEELLRLEFEERLEKEINTLKDRFDYILQNEQIRASYMLREAHRERQEKVSALKTQLECKNLAGLMYVLCAERRKGKLEKMQLVDEYTKYIKGLQDILTESQTLILNLSRGYKTATRVDNEWRTKMIKILGEFQKFVYHFAGGEPETNQYFFDVPALLRTGASLKDNLSEDPCEKEEDQTGADDDMFPGEKTWWDKLDGENRPFIVFGDMAEFKPPQRRQALNAIKTAKLAPKKWKEYVFNEMYINDKCPQIDSMKMEYLSRVSDLAKLDCAIQPDKLKVEQDATRRLTSASVDIRGDMSSILKIITTCGQNQAITKTALLGARDSIEITSTTKLPVGTTKAEKESKHPDYSKVVLDIAKRRASYFNEANCLIEISDDSEPEAPDNVSTAPAEPSGKSGPEEEDMKASITITGPSAADSLEVIPNHVPDKDHRIHNEKVCPMEACQRMRADSFIRHLPAYMHASPFTHFEMTFDQYETCSPEQLEILTSRIDERKKKERADLDEIEEDPLVEWTPSVPGVHVQTSEVLSIDGLPPCTCRAPEASSISSAGRMFDMADLIPVKQALDAINKEFFFNDDVQLNRFKVVGQESNSDCHKPSESDFMKSRLHQIKKILKQHPSLLDIFQNNTQC